MESEIRFFLALRSMEQSFNLGLNVVSFFLGMNASELDNN